MIKSNFAHFISIMLVLVLVAIGTATCTDKKEAPDVDIWTAVAEGNIDAVRQHIDAGTDVSETSFTPGIPGSGGTPLHIAVLNDQEDIAWLLLDNGANIDARAADEFRGMPIHWAAVFGNKQMVTLLVEEGADVNAQDIYGITPLDAVILYVEGLESQVKQEVADYLKDNGSTGSIWTSVGGGYIDMVQQHIDAGTDVNGTFVAPGIPDSGGTPLHIAALTDHEEIARLLLDNGADIDARADDEFRGTPLHLVAFYGVKPMVIFLVETGANVNATDKFGYTPIDAALDQTAGVDTAVKQEIADFLSDNGGITRD